MRYCAVAQRFSKFDETTQVVEPEHDAPKGGFGLVFPRRPGIETELAPLVVKVSARIGNPNHNVFDDL